jgi:hypothetical protein
VWKADDLQSSLKVGEHPCGKVELLGYFQRCLQDKAKHQHATLITLLYTAALGQRGLGSLGDASHRKGLCDVYKSV